MALTKITFDYPVNISLQVGDEAYVSSIESIGPANAQFQGSISEPQHAAKILGVGLDYIIIDKDVAASPVITTGDYILFAKNIIANESSLKGYYADVTLQNYSKTKVELFAVSSEVTSSSK
jgi:hypothetical protein